MNNKKHVTTDTLDIAKTLQYVFEARFSKEDRMEAVETAAARIQAHTDAVEQAAFQRGVVAGLKEAIKQIKLQWKGFGDPAYHGKGSSIMGGLEERFACNQCESAILSIDPTQITEGK